MNIAEADRLRGGFAAARNIAGDDEPCPAADRLWDSAAERLDRRDNESVVRHAAACGACAASWRVAREMLLDEAGAAAQAAELQPVGRTWPRWAGLAAAAMLVLAAGIVVVQQQFTTVGPSEPVYRAPPLGALVSEIDPAMPVPRDDLVLRWSGAPDGSTYDLRVTTARLDPLHRAFGIVDAEYRVPESALAGVSPGETVLWTVTTHLAGGSAWTSPAFRATVD